MKALFVDTSGWMTLADENDPERAAFVRARDKWLEEGGTLLSTDYVLDETLTLIRVRLGLRSAFDWWSQVQASGRLRWEWIDPARAERAREWFFKGKDKEFSFTDCASFIVMRELRLKSALTTDGHFKQAGFRMVP